MIGSVILISLFTLVHFMNPSVTRIKVQPKPMSSFWNNDRLCRQIDDLQIAYDADCAKLLNEFQSEVARRVSPDFTKAHNSVSAAVDRLCGFGTCVKLCYKAAKDKIIGSHDFKDAYISVLDDPIIQPCIHANAVASDMLQKLHLKLKERHSQYVTDLASVYGKDMSANNLPAKDLETLQNCIGKLAGKTQKLNLNTILAGAGVSFEAIFIYQTYKCIIKLFVKPAAKICSSTGTAGICAAADGPLPFGDIVGGVVTIGGLVWTAWDVYEVTCLIPKELKSELKNGVDMTKNCLLKESRSRAYELVMTYRQSGDEINKELKTKLK